MARIEPGGAEADVRPAARPDPAPALHGWKATGRGDAPLRRVGVSARSRTGVVARALERILRFAEREGIELFVEEELQPPSHEVAPLTPDMMPGLDLLLTLGGDGTLLRGARLVAPHGVPVLGINLGRLGFLTSIGPEDLESGFEALRSGEIFLDERMVLETHAENAQGERHGSFLALNDAVLHKGGFARVIRLAVFADGEEVGTYSADGIILSTPTGSTAYSLSAGGPIIVPTVDCIIATPICPHSLAVRPLVLPPQERVTVEVLSPSEELILTVDGQDGAALAPGDRLVIGRAPKPLCLVRLPGQSFFSTLRRKLQWGDLAGRER